MPIADARSHFDEMLSSYGFKLASEFYDHQSFGNACIEYSRRGMRLRLVWEGRDSALYAQVAEVEGHAQASEWSDLEQLVEGQLVGADVARAPDRATRLAEVAKRFLESRRRVKS